MLAARESANASLGLETLCGKDVFGAMTVFIGNLSYSINEQELRHTFEEYGEVRGVRLIRDRETGSSKGFAFVDMPHDHEALHAISQLDHATWEGRTIQVNMAKVERPARVLRA